MTTVKQVIEQKANTIFSVRSSDTVENVLMLMRDHRVRAILVVDDGSKDNTLEILSHFPGIHIVHHPFNR